jgi:hypothetical protein
LPIRFTIASFVQVGLYINTDPYKNTLGLYTFRAYLLPTNKKRVKVGTSNRYYKCLEITNAWN